MGHVPCHWVDAWTSQPQWGSADLCSFSRAKATKSTVTTEPYLLTRPALSPYGRSFSRDLHTAAGPCLSGQLATNASCTSGSAACMLCLSTLSLPDHTERPLLISEPPVRTATPGCQYAKLFCSSFSLLYAFDELQLLDESTPIALPSPLLPV